MPLNSSKFVFPKLTAVISCDVASAALEAGSWKSTSTSVTALLTVARSAPSSFAPCAAALSTVNPAAPWKPADSTRYMPDAMSDADVAVCADRASIPCRTIPRFFALSPADVTRRVVSAW